MKLLLDTYAYLWWLVDDERLGTPCARPSPRRPRPRAQIDPFDRMLVAQAQLEGLTLISADKRLGGYSVSLLDW